MRLVRRLLVALATTLVLLAAAEVGTRVWLRVSGSPYEGRAVEAFLRGAVDEMTGASVEELARGAEEEASESRFPYILHPYVGFDSAVGGRVLNDCVHWHQAPGREGRTSVVFLGGSVAALFASEKTGGSARLMQRLAEQGFADGAAVEVFRFAQGGYKQPQQLMWLAYLTSLGVEPDVVVNLDGYNEVALTLRNVMAGVRFDFPSVGAWAPLAHGSSALDREGVEVLGQAYDARDRAVGDAQFALDWGLSRSALLGTWAERRCRAGQRTWSVAVGGIIDRILKEGQPTRVKGWAHDTALVRAADAWRESSRAMHALCAARGIRYVHVLQPTLDDRGSKPLSPEEKGFQSDGLQAQRVDEGYDLLRARGEELVAAGVEFVDLSMLFAEVPGTVYVDRAHYNVAGNARLAEALASALLN